MVKVAILDNNEAYLKRLHDYWSKTYGSASLTIYVYSVAEQFLEQIQKEKIDIVLVNNQIEIDWDEIPKKIFKLYLVPGKKNGEIDKVPALAKNGRADELYLKMMELYEKHINAGRQVLASQMVLFTSPQGGSGTSCIAVGYGKFLAAQGKKVLYVSLEAVPIVELMLDGRIDRRMEDLFYLCETSRKNLNYSLENTLVQDSSGLFYVAPCRNPIELQEKNKIDIRSMLQTLTGKGTFDVIIVDRELLLDDIQMELMKLADKIVLVTGADNIGRKKLEQILVWIEEWNHRGIPCGIKTKILYNKAFELGEKKQNELGSIPYFNNCDMQEVVTRIGQWQNFHEILMG